ncbi:hypothetical protein LOAG_06701 [Loa loa]|uniref:Apple domain-containing protein n=2 Tax=Loa loa TaxID=7209 RepID=A0A1S0TXD9_LOALO|nr:hypothetical protein LOAG_06701 [Loa loa]EFO21786.2 hypothetical protein LOAG_06701 [Loa loa]
MPISNTRLPLPNSINNMNKNYKSINNAHDITVNPENKKKSSFEMALDNARHVPPPNTINPIIIHRFVKSTGTTIPPDQKTTSYYINYDDEGSNSNGDNKDCDNNNNNNHGDDINDGGNNNNSDNGDDDDDDDGDDDNDNIYNNNEYDDNEESSDLTSHDEYHTTANKDIAYRIAASLLTPVRTIKSAAIRPGPVSTHRNFQQRSEAPIAKVTSTVLYPPTTIITSSTSDIINDNIITIMITATTATTITTTITTTTTTTTTATTTITSKLQFIPVPINMLVPEWNTTIKDSKLSIQHKNYTLNIGIIEQDPNNRQMIRNGLIKELKCFHYFANNQLNDYQQEIIKQIGLQDCLHNCILRTAFLCLSINYNKQTKECMLNDGNRIINNAQLIPSKSIDYYEYIRLENIASH